MMFFRNRQATESSQADPQVIPSGGLVDTRLMLLFNQKSTSFLVSAWVTIGLCRNIYRPLPYLL